MVLTQAFSYRDEQLYCEDVSLRELAEQFGTPSYVYSKNAICRNFQNFKSVFESLNPLICYAVKANSNLSILSLLEKEGSGFDIVSAGELYRLQKIGANPQRIIFSGVGKSLQELEMALDPSLFCINVESLEELEILENVARDKGLRPNIALRLNPDVDTKTHPYVSTGLRQHKFGFDINHIERILQQLKPSSHLNLVGLGCHIGSQILDIQPYLDAFLKLKAMANKLESCGFEIHHLDLGGGIGIPYTPQEKEADLVQYADLLAQHKNNYRFLFEPGRYIVGNAGVLLNKVLYYKTNHEKNFFVVDGAMNDLIRPALYQAHHEILPLEQREETIKADVVGPICETGDFFARDRRLPLFNRGDYLAIMNTGAYGFVAASNYNSRPRPAEILVDGDRSQVIRQRESNADLIRGE